MLTQLHYGNRLPLVPLVFALLAGGIILHLRAQAGVPSPPSTNLSAPSYEVASIKPATPGDRDVGWKTLPNGFDFRNLPLAPLIEQAYGVTLDSQISGLPEWAKSDRYDVSARVDAETAEAWGKLPQHEMWKQQALMLQALFADRCQLKIRREVKELPAYDLLIVKAETKMKEAPPDEKTLIDLVSTTFHGPSGQSEEFTMTMTAHAVTALGLAQNLPHYSGRIVIDKTGLGDKKFDFELKWSSGGADLPDSAQAPSLFKALEEQLGLKLEPVKEPVDTFVVEHIDRPSAN